MKHPRLKIAAMALLTVIGAGLLLPGDLVIPVEGASAADWNHDTFWYAPWGPSGVHKGIDIFAAEGTAVRAAAPGPVLFRGTLGRGGTVVISLGPKWRFHACGWRCIV